MLQAAHHGQRARRLETDVEAERTLGRDVQTGRDPGAAEGQQVLMVDHENIRLGVVHLDALERARGRGPLMETRKAMSAARLP